MSFGSSKASDLKTLTPPGASRGNVSRDVATLARHRGGGDEKSWDLKRPSEKKPDGDRVFEDSKNIVAEERAEASFAEGLRRKKNLKRRLADAKFLGTDRWLARHGHGLTYVGLFLFSVMVLFRPYELIPGLGFLSTSAFYIALLTVAVYIPSQLAAEGNLTHFSAEVKAVLAMTLIALVSIPIARDPAMAWQTFDDTFSKAVVMFIVMVNAVRTRRRLMGMIWLSLSIGVILSAFALNMYATGQLTVEGYRVGGSIGGMFQNPNELSMHLVMMFPLAVALGLAARNPLSRIAYLGVAVLLVGANMVTYSRGGFLALIAASAVLVWKYGRRNRVGVTVAAAAAGFLVVLFAPGSYALRILSIFGLAADPVGSSDQRMELLWRSLIVTLRNPWGIGIGNFPIVGVRNLVSHNSYTQVSSELGLLGLVAYLVFLVSPFRKLAAIERIVVARGESGWFMHLAVGLQASLVAYFVASFFASVAYTWFVYYIVAYAVAFRRIFAMEGDTSEEVPDAVSPQAA